MLNPLLRCPPPELNVFAPVCRDPNFLISHCLPSTTMDIIKTYLSNLPSVTIRFNPESTAAGLPLSGMVTENREQFLCYLSWILESSKIRPNSNPKILRVSLGKYELKVFYPLPTIPSTVIEHTHLWNERSLSYGKDHISFIRLVATDKALRAPNDIDYSQYDNWYMYLDEYIHPRRTSNYIHEIFRDYALLLNKTESQLLKAWTTLNRLMDTLNSARAYDPARSDLQWHWWNDTPIPLPWPECGSDDPLLELLRRYSYMAAYQFTSAQDRQANRQADQRPAYSETYDPLQELTIRVRGNNILVPQASKGPFMIHVLCAYVLQAFGPYLDEICFKIMQAQLDYVAPAPVVPPARGIRRLRNQPLSRSSYSTSSSII